MSLFRLRRLGRVRHLLAVTALAIPSALLSGRALGFRGPILPPEPLPASALLDMHCHVAGIGAGDSGCFVSPRLRKSWKFSFYLRAFGVSRRDLGKLGDSACGERLSEALAASRHVNRAVVLAIDGVVDSIGNLDPA